MIFYYVAFVFIAILYSSVGFGGGSLYISVLTFSPINVLWLPIIALVCNIAVVFGNCLHHLKEGTLNFSRILPFVVLSIPMAFMGGKMAISATALRLILGGVLLVVSGLMVFQKKKCMIGLIDWPFASVFLGAGIGLLSGIVGIGGGIFLSPILHIFFQSIKKSQIPAICSFYILVNSISGLGGQLLKHTKAIPIISLFEIILPFVALVILGSLVGNRLRFRLVKETSLTRLTAGIVFFAGLKLLAT